MKNELGSRNHPRDPKNMIGGQEGLLFFVSFHYSGVLTSLTHVGLILKAPLDSKPSLFNEEHHLIKYVTFSPMVQCKVSSGKQYV